jgi:hypothetical protein
MRDDIPSTFDINILKKYLNPLQDSEKIKNIMNNDFYLDKRKMLEVYLKEIRDKIIINNTEELKSQRKEEIKKEEIKKNILCISTNTFLNNANAPQLINSDGTFVDGYDVPCIQNDINTTYQLKDIEFNKISMQYTGIIIKKNMYCIYVFKAKNKNNDLQQGGIIFNKITNMGFLAVVVLSKVGHS